MNDMQLHRETDSRSQSFEQCDNSSQAQKYVTFMTACRSKQLDLSKTIHTATTYGVSMRKNHIGGKNDFPDKPYIEQENTMCCIIFQNRNKPGELHLAYASPEHEHSQIAKAAHCQDILPDSGVSTMPWNASGYLHYVKEIGWIFDSSVPIDKPIVKWLYSNGIIPVVAPMTAYNPDGKVQFVPAPVDV